MKRIHVPFIILCLAILGAACSRTQAHEAQAENVAPRTIATSGRAVVHVPPDRAELVLGVETRDKRLAVAKKENDARIRKLLAIVGDHGIEPKDVHTSWISIHTFRHSEDRSHRDRARDMGVNAAREKAEAMAKSLGQRVGRPILVSEASPTWINPMSNANVFNDGASEGASDAGDTLAPGTIRIDARVSVTFEMLD